MAQRNLNSLTDSPWYRVMNTLGKWVLTALCWLVFSIPLFTAGAASCAAMEEFLPENQEAAGTLRRFSRNFRRHFRTMTPLWLLFLMAAALLVLDLAVYDALMGGDGIAGTVLKTLIFILLNYLVGLLRLLQFEQLTDAPPAGGKAVKAAAVSALLHWSAWTSMMLIDIALAVFFWFTPYFLFLIPMLPGVLAWMHCNILLHACHFGKKPDGFS